MDIQCGLFMVPEYELGNFFGPTILSDVKASMEYYKVYYIPYKDGPFRYGCGASMFTTSGVATRKFQTEIEVGQVGINVPISVPLPFSSFTSSKPSFAGQAGIQFYTQIKTVTQQWKDLAADSDIATLQVTNS
ncbi:hypothetical protein CRYUN_Cryun10bG0102400 [Craigia yunnanensis]